MAIYKQIQVNFWQNAFVLDLTPEERYFYIYLITNTLTSACGIYRFNLKLAVLETGLSSEVINNYLNTFESSGKIAVSKNTGEIMIMNWLKHNPKMNKKIIGQINGELKEVKDKELLKQFYEICKRRQYPVEEIFNGVVLPSEVKIESGNDVKIQPDSIVQAVLEAAKAQEADAAASQLKAEEVKAPPELMFTARKSPSAGNRRRKVNEKPHEEVEVYETWGEDEDDNENKEAIKDTAVTTWSFNDSGDAFNSTG